MPIKSAHNPPEETDMKTNLIVTAIATAFLAAPLSAYAGEAELLARIEKMAAELEQLKAELKANERKT
jgi:hypothetical protein